MASKYIEVEKEQESQSLNVVMGEVTLFFLTFIAGAFFGKGLFIIPSIYLAALVVIKFIYRPIIREKVYLHVNKGKGR